LEKIKALDPVGTVIQLLTYEDVRIDRVDYGDLSYDSTEFSEIKLTLSYRKEKLEY